MRNTLDGLTAVRFLPFAVFHSTPIYILPTFAMGVSLAELHRRGFRGTRFAPVLLLAVLGAAGQYNERFAGLNFVTLPLIALTLLFAARYRRGEEFARVFINRLTVYLGDISYAFVIFQIPLVLGAGTLRDRRAHSASLASLWFDAGTEFGDSCTESSLTGTAGTSMGLAAVARSTALKSP